MTAEEIKTFIATHKLGMGIHTLPDLKHSDRVTLVYLFWADYLKKLILKKLL